MATEEFTWADLNAFRRDVVILEALLSMRIAYRNVPDSDSLRNEIEIYNSEFRRLLALTAALTRRVFERLQNEQNESLFDGEECGFIWEDASRLEKCKELKIKPACNQIIHADETDIHLVSENIPDDALQALTKLRPDYDTQNCIKIIAPHEHKENVKKFTLLHVSKYRRLCYDLCDEYTRTENASKGD